jgi:hypothetical protein
MMSFLAYLVALKAIFLGPFQISFLPWFPTTFGLNEIRNQNQRSGGYIFKKGKF